MNTKFIFYIPEGLENTENVKEVERLLSKIKLSYGIEIDKHIINNSEEQQIKSQFLWRLSVINRIGIKQTARTKSLYPQLVIFNRDNPFTFYPQSYGKKYISIEEFLEDLLKNRIKCLHDGEEVEKLLLEVKNDK